MAGYTFSYTDITDPANPVPTSFSLGGINDNAAKGIRFGLRKVPTIKDVTVERITETRDSLPVGDPTP